MPSVQPYEAWFFFGADDTDEVNAEYERVRDIRMEEGGYVEPQLADRVTVVAVERGTGHSAGLEYVWFIRNGRVEHRDSWTIRKAL